MTAPNETPAPRPGQTVWAIDAHSLIFQVFHALPEMASPGGEEVGAVFGFIRDILFLIEKKKPDFLLCAFDMSGPTFRHELFADYKVHRAEMPPTLPAQIEKIREVLGALGVPILESPGYEADDVLAGLARVCEEQQLRCYVVTSDKDCRQLISDYVSLYNVRKNLVMDAVALEKDWGIRPDQVVDFQALVGDKVDNVPGVDLIGPKTATDLLNNYGDLVTILDRAAWMKKSKRQENLVKCREQALLSQRLVRLDRDLPLDIDWEAARIGPVDHRRVDELFAQFGFRTLGERVAVIAPQEVPESVWDADYELINTPQLLDALLQKLRQFPRISIDTETTSTLPRWAELVGVSIAWEPGQACYLPFRAPPGEQVLPLAESIEKLRPLLEDEGLEKVGQNLKFDIIVLRGAGIELRGMSFDTMVASYLLDAGERNHGMDELSKRFLQHTPVPIKDLIGSGKQQKRMDEIPLVKVTDYAAEDADVPLRLHPLLGERLGQFDLVKLNEEVEVPLVEVLADMEYAGIRVDRERLSELSDKYGRRLEALEAEIYALAGCEFNIASPKQLGEVLFEKLKLRAVKKTKSGPSTGAAVLEQLAKEHELPAKLLAYRQFAKLKNTYVDTLPELIHPATGRVHASFNQVVTATGRLSSSDPNLQNIPVRSDRGREIRSAFLAREGWQLLAADYSQVELRVLAHFCQDEPLCEAFYADQDIHARVASEVFAVPLEEITSDMRRTAKAVNFGVIYGQGAYGLAAALGIEKSAAADFIRSYFERYPRVDNFLQETLERCRQNGYVTTVLGRRRSIRGVRAGAGRQRNLPERTAINTVVQGSAADLIKLAMLRIHRRLNSEGLAAKMLLQIHDELIFEVPSHELDPLGKLVSEEMAGVLELRVPLKVDLKSGSNWAACEPW